MGKSRLRVVTMWNTRVFLYYSLLIAVLFICITTTNLLLPHPVFTAERWIHRNAGLRPGPLQNFTDGGRLSTATFWQSTLRPSKKPRCESSSPSSMVCAISLDQLGLTSLLRHRHLSTGAHGPAPRPLSWAAPHWKVKCQDFTPWL